MRRTSLGLVGGRSYNRTARSRRLAIAEVRLIATDLRVHANFYEIWSFPLHDASPRQANVYGLGSKLNSNIHSQWCIRFNRGAPLTAAAGDAMYQSC